MEKCLICGEEDCQIHADIPVVKMDGFAEVLELFGTGEGLLMLRDRPYMGQAWTDSGERGKTEIKGITFRDLMDCFIRACCLSDGDKNDESTERYDQALKGQMADLCGNDVYKLNWDKIDPMAVAQNLTCEVEKIMGIFPNIPRRLM